MAIRLYDSKVSAVVDFAPLVAGRATIYLCGPTVQSSPHIGHLRSALVYDIWRRWLSYRGYQVTLIRNVTDIDDKVLDLSRGTAEPWWARAYRVEREFNSVYDAVGILPPTYEPRATAHIPEIQALIQNLVERGHAYRAQDGTADVYFDTASWAEYGELTHQNRDSMEPATDARTVSKRDPRDFALWKSPKEGEPSTASWPSPWGRGRPGWHIECSAMSRKYLGPAFDIHGGGMELRFPHHENEIAQSRAVGDSFATHWLHNGLVMVSGQKMSKSLGNSLYAADILSSASPLAVRYLLGAAHYRSPLDYSDASLVEAQTAIDRVAQFLLKAEGSLPGLASSDHFEVPTEFADAMDNDLSVPQALAVLHRTVRAGNTAINAHDMSELESCYRQVSAMTGALGIDPRSPSWAAPESNDVDDQFQRFVDSLLEQRASARNDGDFAKADGIRDVLNNAGISIEDTADGSEWRTIST